ncbi:MAG: trypsin-like peptidase domain-containing protein [Desulfobulbaceae bacterium]|jgi:hypothetical protein|nr:trypsin-like peptidase domain-containing protein [Desulfobulbaceae bacterium]
MIYNNVETETRMRLKCFVFVVVLILFAVSGCGIVNRENALGDYKNAMRTSDCTKRKEGLLRAAEQGLPQAQNKLGTMYKEGTCLSRDYGEAVKWYRQAAEQGSGEGQFNLGAMYKYGLGVEQSDTEARRWYEQAGKNGYEQGLKEAKRLEDCVKELDAALPGTTLPSWKDCPSKSSGSGFLVQGGYVLTCSHVVGDDKARIFIEYKGKDFPASILLRDKNFDFSVLKVDGLSEGADFSLMNTAVNSGTDVFILGHPIRQVLGTETKYRKGYVSGFSCPIGKHMDTNSCYQINAPVSPGDSGAPMFDKAGNLVGIILSRSSYDSTVKYASKAHDLLPFLQKIDNFPRPRPPKAEVTEREQEETINSLKLFTVFLRSYRNDIAPSN